MLPEGPKYMTTPKLGETPPAPATPDACDRLINDGQVLVKIGETLRQLPDDASRARVIRAVAAFYDIELPRSPR